MTAQKMGLLSQIAPAAQRPLWRAAVTTSIEPVG